MCDSLPCEYDGISLLQLCHIACQRAFADVIRIANCSALKWRSLGELGEFSLVVADEEIREVACIRTGHTITRVEMEGSCDKEWVQPLAYASAPSWQSGLGLDSPAVQMA